MQCVFCQLPEFQLNYLSQKIREVKYGKDATGIICSNCVQKIFSLSRERLQEFQELNRKKEKDEAVNYIQGILFSKEEENNEGEKRTPRSRFLKRGRDTQTVRNFTRDSSKGNKRKGVSSHQTRTKKTVL